MSLSQYTDLNSLVRHHHAVPGILWTGGTISSCEYLVVRPGHCQRGFDVHKSAGMDDWEVGLSDPSGSIGLGTPEQLCVWDFLLGSKPPLESEQGLGVLPS